jgi:two-component system CheB/CheR fusion protein
MAHAAALEQRAPPSALVDEAMRVLHISPSVGHFMLPSEGPFTTDLTALVNPELRVDLKLALDRAITHQQSTLTLPAVVMRDGVKHRVALQVTPVVDSRSAGKALVFFLDCGQMPDSPDADADGEPAGLKRLREELSAAQTRLSESRREHELAIQDLRVANEELQSINEEYRSTAEELETSKEELQSMNEELHTVNGELKSKLVAISTAHDDLLNLMAATEIGTLFLDPELRIKLFTPTIATVFNITEADIGRSISDFTHRLIYDDMEKDARSVLETLVPKESEVATKNGRWLMMRLRPYRTVDDRIDGVVLTLFDITSRRTAESRQKSSEERYRQLFNSIDEGFCVMEMLFDPADRPIDYRFLEVNAAFERQTGLKDPIGRTMRSLEPNHEQHWFDTYGRIAQTGRSERFEAAAAQLGKHYDVFAFRVGDAKDRRIAAIFNDITERRRHIEHIEFLMREVNHRSKNMLALVQAIARQTVRRHPENFLATFIERVQSLSAAQNLLVQNDWKGVQMSALVHAQCAMFEGLPGNRIKYDGEAINITPTASQAIAMALHELCTNACKYGALSNSTGRVDVAWAVRPDQNGKTFELSWKESGGPRITAPSRSGFGTSVIRHVIETQLRGKVRLDYASEGLSWQLRCPDSMVLAPAFATR